MLLKRKRIILAGFAALFIVNFSLFAQTNAPSRSVLVILDVSGSMNDQNRFTNVQDYLDTEIIDNFIEYGDVFSLVTFGEKVEERFTRTITSTSGKVSLKEDLRRIKPDENYTDIGAALEKLAEILEEQKNIDTRQVVLFITDGLNAPPPDSKYRGIDLSADEGLKSLGEKISRGSWFLYVIGIGGKTAAQDVVNLIPGAELQATGSDLSDVDVGRRIAQLEEEERLKKEAEERARKEPEPEPDTTPINSFQRLMNALGLPVFASGILLVFISALIPLILIIVIFIRAFKTRELIIADDKESVVKRIPVMGRVMLNSPSFILSGIGNENDRVFRIERGLFGFKIQTLNSQAMAENSPFSKIGAHPFKGGVVNLTNGRTVRITIN
jgi:hypothetical protein